MCLSQVKSPFPVTLWGDQTLILNPASNIAVVGPGEQSEESCSTEAGWMKSWLLSHSLDYPPALITVYNYITCPSPLIRLANACERWSRVTVTQSQICFDSLCCHLLVVSDYFRFSKSWQCVFLVGAGQRQSQVIKAALVS